MAKKIRKEVKAKKEEEVKKTNDSKVFGFLAVFLTLIGFLIAILARKEDKYVVYYGKQGLVLFIAFVIAQVVGWIPVVGWIASPVLYILSLVLWIIGWVNALSGEMKPLPLLQSFADGIKI